ncbi:MAG: PHP domain-containing protein [Lachnospiraceae bacterium]|nr:PHP domain-containing protein [Lachnospiraceae bacterium]
MPYKYETHLHTAGSSACGRARGTDYLEGYKALGYDGIFITEHFYLGNTCIPRSLPWDEWVDRFCRSYYETKERGDKTGISVFFGWESTYGTGEDFLIYGLKPEWLKKHPEIIRLTQEQQYELVHSEGGLVVQAHPFRERGYMDEIRLHPNHCDAWEIANSGNLPYMDLTAYEYASSHGMTMTCGSDIHTVERLKEDMVFAMVTDERLRSELDYVRIILSGRGFGMSFPKDRLSCEPKEPELPVIWCY